MAIAYHNVIVHEEINNTSFKILDNNLQNRQNHIGVIIFADNK